MKPMRIFAVALLSVAILLPLPSSAQEGGGSGYKFAARLNLLGVLNLDAIGEIEYLFTDRFGLFVGGGVSSPTIEAGNILRFPKGGFTAKAGGVYVGARIPLSVWNVKGFSLKPFIVGRWFSTPPDSLIVLPIPQSVVYLSQEVGAYLSLVYTQPLGSRFFIEPSIGLGASIGKFSGGKEMLHTYLGLGVPLQFNLGFRF